MSLKIRRSGGWVNIPDGALNVRHLTAWKNPRKVWIKKNGVWVDTGYVGKPNPPETPTLVVESYNSISVRSLVSASGVPATGLRIVLCNSSGTVLQSQDVASGVTATFNGLSIDTNYLFKAYGLNGAVLSNASGEFHRRTGHPEQSYQQPNYGWVNNTMKSPTQNNGTSEHEALVHPGALAADGNLNSAWVSGPRDGSLHGVYWEGLRFQIPAGQRFNGVAVNLTTSNAAHLVWLGIFQNNAWKVGYSGVTPYIGGNIGMDDPLPGALSILNHAYWEGYDNQGVISKNFPQSGAMNYGMEGVTYFDVAVSRLLYDGGAYRAQIAEVYYWSETWGIVSYSTVVTVAFAPNSTW